LAQRVNLPKLILCYNEVKSRKSIEQVVTMAFIAVLRLINC
jgi:hypothetical protein